MKSTKIALNVKNMIASMKQARSREDVTEIHNTFCRMYNLGFISREEWFKFADTTESWTIEGGKLVDADTGEEIA